MNDKPWWKSKSIWAGIIIAGVGIGEAVGFDLPIETILALANALGIVGLRQAISNN